MRLAWDRGRAPTTVRKTPGIWSVEKKVLQRKDMGVMM